jgi:imidazolonepropionase-like amidohydrolase
MRLATCLIVAGALLPAAASGAETPSLVAIRGARIVTVSGPTIEKGTVVIADGLIREVGESVTPPAGAWIIDGAGLTVYPGLIDAFSAWGLPAPAAGARPQAAPQRQTAAPAPAQSQRSWGPEDRPGTTSWIKAADQLDPNDRRLELARSAGFTTAVTFPAGALVAGHGAVINLAGASAGEMVVHPLAGLRLGLSARGVSGYPNSLMGVISYFRQLWLDAAHYQQAKEMYEKNPAGLARPAYDRALEGVLEAERVMMPAASRVEIERMSKLAGELKTPAVLFGGHEGYRAAELLKRAGVSVVVNVKWPTKARDLDPQIEESYRVLELRDRAPTTPIALAAAGVPFAFTSEGLDSPREIIAAIRKSVDLGLKKEDAIRALTLGAARIYGVDNRMGAIEAGKIANLTVVKGELFDALARVEMVFIDGRKFEPAPEPAGGRRGEETR